MPFGSSRLGKGRGIVTVARNVPGVVRETGLGLLYQDARDTQTLC